MINNNIFKEELIGNVVYKSKRQTRNKEILFLVPALSLTYCAKLSKFPSIFSLPNKSIWFIL